MTESGTFAPEMGTFAVLTIDPVASVDYLADPEATAAASKLVGKDYVICAPALKSLFNPRAAFREETAYFVQQGPPQDFPTQFIDASMSIPIAPQTCSVEDHPSKREPLNMANNPFPWSDCYLSAFATAPVRTANVRIMDVIVCGLDKQEQLRVLRMTNDDAELRLDRLEEHGENAGVATDSDAAEKASEHETEKDGESERENEVEANEIMDETEAVAILRDLLSNEAPEHLPAVKFTYDLSRVKEINDPRRYWEEVQKISEIGKASKARREADKVAIAEKDAARYDSRMAELLEDHQAAGLRIPRAISRGVACAKSLLLRILCMSPDSHAT